MDRPTRGVKLTGVGLEPCGVTGEQRNRVAGIGEGACERKAEAGTDPDNDSSSLGHVLSTFVGDTEGGQ
jgi:hypothetical protein